MQTREWTFRDKSTWGAGPWQSEPDKRQWTDAATGLPCLIVRGPSGALCGYVGVPKSHPLHGKGYGDTAPLSQDVLRDLLERRGVLNLYDDDLAKGAVEIGAALDVHGGLTFAGACAKGEPEHGICHRPDPGEGDDVWWLGFDCAHCYDIVPAYAVKGYPPEPDEVYRDRAYVEAECAKLAKQLAEIA